MSKSKIISEQSLNKIKDASITDIIGKSVPLKRKGSSSQACCPFHTEKTPSFIVTETKNLYKCFGCGKSGDGINFVMEYEKKNFIEACETIAELAGITIEYEEREFTAKEKEIQDAALLQEDALNFVIPIYQKNLFDLPKNHSVKKYLSDRKIDDETISKWQIGWGGTEWKGITTPLINKGLFEPANKLGIIKRSEDRNFDGFRSRITIPICDKNGRNIGLEGRYFETEHSDKTFPKYINTSECELYSKRPSLFGLNHAIKSINQNGFVIIVEGHFDVISSHRVNQKNVVGTSGTAFTIEQMQLIKKCTTHVKLMFDNDTAGSDAFNKALPELLKQDLKVDIILYDEKYKDPDSMIAALDKDAFTNTVSTDAIMYRSKQLWNNANGDPYEISEAIKELSDLLCCIKREAIRDTYAYNIQKELKIKNSLLKNEIKIKVGKIEKEDFVKAKNEREENLDESVSYLIKEDNGRYYSTAKGGLRVISNFTMKVKFQVQTGSDKAYRLVEIKNEVGVKKMLLMNTDNFVSRGNFKKEIAREGNFVFKGSDDDLANLQEILQNDETPCYFIEQMGWNNQHQIYAWCNGISTCENNISNFLPCDNFGIIEYQGKHLFIPANSEIFKNKDDMFGDEKKFKNRPQRDDFHFKDWASLFCKVYGDKAKAAISFYIAALFRDIVYKHMLRFPMLNLYGPPQFGKGAIAESLLSMFGERQKPLMLEAGSTMVGIQRKIAAMSNGISLLDEYKNSLDRKVIGSIKGIYDGHGRTTGMMTNDLQTRNTSVKNGVMVVGQDIPIIDPALYTRMVMLSFDEGKFSNDGREHFSKLKEMEEDGGFSDITVSLLKYRQLIENGFKASYKLVSKQVFTEVDGSGIEDRMIVNISILLAMVYILKDEIELPFSYDDCKSFLIKNMEYQYSILAGNDDVSKFWGIVENLAYQKQIIYDRDFFIRDGFLFIRLNHVHPLYFKELKQRGDPNGLSSVESLRHYLQLNKQAYVELGKQRFPGDISISTSVSADKFKYSELKIELPLLNGSENFNHNSYTTKDEDHIPFTEDEEEPFPILNRN